MLCYYYINYVTIMLLYVMLLLLYVIRYVTISEYL